MQSERFSLNNTLICVSNIYFLLDDRSSRVSKSCYDDDDDDEIYDGKRFGVIAEFPMAEFLRPHQDDVIPYFIDSQSGYGLPLPDYRETSHCNVISFSFWKLRVYQEKPGFIQYPPSWIFSFSPEVVYLYMRYVYILPVKIVGMKNRLNIYQKPETVCNIVNRQQKSEIL